MWESQSPRRARLPDDWEENYRKPVMKRDRGLCQIRGPRCIHRATQIDHRDRGDDHSLSNLRAACKNCHADKSAQEGVQARFEKRAKGKRLPERHPGRM
jgi:5-methylcytosine-specific restriction endonuclease McrA